jgi:dTDP-4-dehydrorhamnose reductase
LKNRVLVLGSTGLIGHQVYNYLDSTGQYDLYNFAYRTKLKESTIILDARNETDFFRAIDEVSPDFIINCIGLLINAARDNPEDAIFLNAYMPHRLAALADSLKAKLIHVSTDCVFSGNKGIPYLEDDYKDGTDTYAKTKGLGEVINNKHLTLRTSVVGPELKSDGEELFHWFMNQVGDISGFTKSIWSGVTTIQLAKAVECSIRRDITGLHHVTNNSSINKYDLLRLFKKHTKKDINIIQVDGKKANKSFIDSRGLFDFKIPSYDLMVSEMVKSIKINKSLYVQYDID